MFKSRSFDSPGTFFMVFLVMYQLVFTQTLYMLQSANVLLFLRSPGGMILLQLALLLLPLMIWLAIKKERLADHLPNMKLGRTNAILIVGITFFLLPFMSLLSGLMATMFPNPVAGFLDELRSLSFPALLLAAAVTPAIVEEVVFRGYIQSQYPARPFWQVALINGLFFGIIHMNPQQFLYAFAMGVVLAFMVHHTRSIRAGILSHFLVNALNISLFRLASWLADRMEETEGLTALEEAAEASPWAGLLSMGVLALIFLPILIILLRSFLSHNRQRNAAYDIRQALSE